MKKIQPLDSLLLRKKLNPKQLDFVTTAELETLTEFVGQQRALEALRFGIDIKSHGYNLYAMGPSGIGKRSMIRTVVEQHAAKAHFPPDWCYIHNFYLPDRPMVLELAPGTGIILQQDMKRLIFELSSSILGVFESDEYRARMDEIIEEFNIQREKATTKVLENTKSDKIPHLYKERHKKEKVLQLRYTSAVVEPLINRLKRKYAEVSSVVNYLDAVQEDIITHVNDFVKHDENTNVLFFPLENPELIKYQVNVLVDNGDLKGAPVIFEENPSYSRLICRVEHTQLFGTLVTNFTLIRPGALHQANGGYLIIEARKLKKERRAWEALKRALYSRKIRIESIEQPDSVKPVSLEPYPIPLDVKIILLGDRKTYYSLCNHDPDFSELFKVAVDFDEQIDRNKKNLKLYARLIGTIARREGLRPFHADAVAAIIDQSSRIAEDTEKLSTHVRSIDDLILEADYWAGLNQKKVVDAKAVSRAIDAQIHRIDRARELYYEDIDRDFILIKTSGSAIGQINCLSVVKVGNFSYGHPTRITAKVRIGQGKFIDIQREIHLSGPLHNKAGLIISNFLASRYNQDEIFSLSASLSFEQIYGNMDGDSASVAELCALLSALAEVPLKQYLAVTGSVNQYGEVQAVGCVNEKIEGFFDICKARGLTGKQGVIIPTVNEKNLMLRAEVVEAAKKHKFSIYTIQNVDEAITLLSGMAAGIRLKNGSFTLNSINYRVEKKLKLYAMRMKQKQKFSE